MSENLPIGVTPETVSTLSAMFRERVRISADELAYRYYDDDTETWRDTSWGEMGTQIARWQAAMETEGLQPGERVAIMMRNCREWIMFDQAAMGLGLVVVPLYNDDRADNVCYIIEQADVKLLVIEGREQWCKLETVRDQMPSVKRIVSIGAQEEPDEPRMTTLDAWLPADGGVMRDKESSADALVSIVYTSGTTGRPKGVMLSHNNILSNAYSAYQCLPSQGRDIFLSFLPLSHMLERTVGYHLPVMAGSAVAFARSVPQLGEDLLAIRPTMMVSVPRIYERVYAKVQAQLEQKPPSAAKMFNKTVEVGWARFLYQQGRGPWKPSFLLWPLLKKLVAQKILDKLGGRLRIAVSGGAPLSGTVAKVFIGLGVPIYNGYGLTESSPIISANIPGDNDPYSIGKPMPGIEVRIGANDELLARGPNIMMGYWQNEQATKEAIDEDGWLHTGDKARFEDGRLYITGRIKEIIVLGNGEKVPPADMEMAIANDTVFEQVLVLGEGMPYLSAIAVLNPEQWQKVAAAAGIDPADIDSKQAQSLILDRISRNLHSFPGYAQIRKVTLTTEQWTVVNGLQTPTLKLKRARIIEHHAADIEKMYEGHRAL